MSRRPRVVCCRAAALALGLAACASADPDPPIFHHDRHGYAAFRAQHPELLEPSYLPFMTTWVRLPAPGPLARLAGRLGLGGAPADLLVVCRWPDEAFPLRVHVAAPDLSAADPDRLDPRPPAAYVAAVERALEIWERSLDGAVRFARVDDPAGADLRIQLEGAVAPEPESGVRVLGSTHIGEACRVRRGDADDPVLEVEFAVSEMRVFVADRHGLLLPDQIERVALHEIGHALGMRGHSPIPADLMYPIVRERLPRGELGLEDVNSFASFYALPNGTVYARVPPGGQGERPPPRAPTGPPRLALAPHVDARLGFELQLPEGWIRVPMERGVVAVDGVTWDYDVSYQVLVRPSPSIDAYLGRYAPAYFGQADIVAQEETQVAGRPALRFALAANDAGMQEQLTFVEAGDGRVLVLIAESPAAVSAGWRSWFDAVEATLELRGPGGAGDRDYRASPDSALPRSR